MFCYALFRLKPDSSKLGVVAKLGKEPEETDYVFTEKGVEVNTVEWRAHIKSRDDWMEYTRELKTTCREFGRYGLVNRITAYNDYLDEIGDWQVCAEYIQKYMKSNKGRLKVVKDTDTYLAALRKIARCGGPPPAALTVPAGGLVAETPGPAAEARTWAEALEQQLKQQMETLRARLEQFLAQLGPAAPAGPSSGALTRPALAKTTRFSEPAATDAASSATLPVRTLEEKAAAKAERWKLLREKWANQKAARKAERAAAPETAAAAPAVAPAEERQRPGFVSSDRWAAMSGAERYAIHEQRRLADGEPRNKKRKERGAESGSSASGGQAEAADTPLAPAAQAPAAQAVAALPAAPPEKSEE